MLLKLVVVAALGRAREENSRADRPVSKGESPPGT